jgi:hypothetical protein
MPGNARAAMNRSNKLPVAKIDMSVSKPDMSVSTYQFGQISDSKYSDNGSMFFMNLNHQKRINATGIPQTQAPRAKLNMSMNMMGNPKVRQGLMSNIQKIKQRSTV